MINTFKTNKISKEEFLKINENDVMFITNPGRMGDEDGTTFIVKTGNDFIIYRIDGWMYPKNGEKVEITLDDALKQFPKWDEAWKNGNNEKYKYLYMGFGNGLSVDYSIYNEFKPFLDKKIEEFLEDKEDKKSLKDSAIFSVWKQAFINMMNNKK